MVVRQLSEAAERVQASRVVQALASFWKRIDWKRIKSACRATGRCALWIIRRVYKASAATLVFLNDRPQQVFGTLLLLIAGWLGFEGWNADSMFVTLPMMFVAFVLGCSGVAIFDSWSPWVEDVPDTSDDHDRTKQGKSTKRSTKRSRQPVNGSARIDAFWLNTPITLDQPIKTPMGSRTKKITVCVDIDYVIKNNEITVRSATMASGGFFSRIEFNCASSRGEAFSIDFISPKSVLIDAVKRECAPESSSLRRMMFGKVLNPR